MSRRDRLVAAVAIVLGLGLCVGALAGFGQVLRVTSETFRSPPGPPVAAPDPAALPAAVADLDRAATAHGVCYGWSLVEVISVGAEDRSRDVSAGSNAGAGLRVTGEPRRCPRWIELRVTMTYRSRSGVDADITVATAGLNGPSAAQLARLGFDDGTFEQHPGATTLAAVLALPLATAELRGTAPLPAATATPPPPPAAAPPLPAATATAPSRRLADVGGDFRRDRGAALVVATLLLLAAGVCAVVLRRVQARARHRDAVAAARVTPRPRVQGRPRGHSGNLDAVRSARHPDRR